MKKALRIIGWIVFAIYVVVALGIMGFGIYTQYINPKEQPAPLPGQEMGLRPNVAGKLDLDPIPTDEKEKIAWAYNLYCIANLNWVQMDNVAMAVNFDTMMKLGSEIHVNGYQFYVKTPEEYWHTEYSFVLGGGIMDGMMSAISPESTTYAARTYTNKNATKMVKQLTTNGTAAEAGNVPTYTQLEDNSFQFISYWDSATTTELDMAQFYSGQPGFKDSDREMTDQRILPETILSAKITYHADEGYYEMELELDIENPKTTEITRQQLINSTGDPNAGYTKMVETIEIWDNGYYRYFHSVDSWMAPKAYGFIRLESVLDYNTYFYYDSHSIDPNNYQDMIEYREYLQQNNLI